MENNFKLRLSKMFRSSFGSCRSRNLEDTIGKPVFVSQNSHSNLDATDPPPPQIIHRKIQQSYPSICKPRCPITGHELVRNTCIIAKEAFVSRNKVAGRYSLFYSSDSSPCRKVEAFDGFNEFQSRKKVKRFKTKNKKLGRAQKSKKTNNFLFSSENETEEEDETETLFSSKSFSSESSKSRRRRHPNRRERVGKHVIEMGMKESIAVVKRSSDPYGDFRTSMVEMIVERQIFSAKDLEQLLQCFLRLNSDHHHKVIVEVFMEIWEALFCNWS